MNFISKVLKKFLVFLSNKLVFMFIRHTLIEHMKLLCIIISSLFIIVLFISVPLYFDFASLSSESWPIVTWFSDVLMKFFDLEKMLYIALTYAIALIVYLAAEEMIENQTKRDQIPREKFVEELKINTRAVVITMGNTLSLMLKILVGISLILIIFKYLGGNEENKYINSNIGKLFKDTLLFIAYDSALFFIQKSLVKNHELLTERHSSHN